MTSPRHVRRTGARAWLAALGGGALLLAGCGAGGEGAGSDTIVIGGVGPLSQPGAVQAGQEMKWAMERAVADLNADGGVLDRQVELTFEDTQNTPDVAAAVAKKLVEEDEVVGVVGEYHSGAALAQIPTYNENGTPAVFVETWNDTITAGDPDDPSLPPEPESIFRIAPTTSYATQSVIDWLVEGVEPAKVVQVYEATEFGLGQADSLKAGLDGTGIELAQIEIELNQPDYTSVLSRVNQQHADADVVVIDVTGESSYVAVQNAFTTGLLGEGRICFTNQAAQDDEAFWRAVPDGAGCSFRYVGPAPAQFNDQAAALAERFSEEVGGAPKAWVFESYDGIMLLADAIERAGSTEPEEIVAALEETSYQGTQGTYEFPYVSGNPVPEDQPAWLWHQWPEPLIQILEYTEKDQPIEDTAVLWPPDKQTDGAAYVEPTG